FSRPLSSGYRRSSNRRHFRCDLCTRKGGCRRELVIRWRREDGRPLAKNSASIGAAGASRMAGETLQKIDDAVGAGRPGQHRIDRYIRAPGQFGYRIRLGPPRYSWKLKREWSVMNAHPDVLPFSKRTRFHVVRAWKVERHDVSCDVVRLFLWRCSGFLCA